jgi:hypothetical protein
MRFESDRFSPKQIQTPKTIIGVAQERQPRWALIGSSRFEVLLQYSANDIFVDFHLKAIEDLLGDARTSASGISTFKFIDSLNDFRTRPLGSRLAIWL